VQSSFLEYPLPVLIQSGDTFSLNKFNVQSDTNKLNSETVYLNVCGKYKDMQAMASRTLLVNPEDDQKSAYLIANEALDVAIRNLKVGQPIKDAYLAAKKFISDKDAKFANKIHSNFGFGVSPYIYIFIIQIGSIN
jgi:nucleosome binding factor SPN SPT16 subunit